MRLFKNLPAIVLVILLAVCLFAYYSTRESGRPAAPQKSAAAEQPLVDTSLLQGAVKLTPLAAALDEQAQAREAWRLADHELELGNWTDTGHPTGRRVSFSNSFAMEHHYFNFSTAGQWLWDEIRVTLPPGGDPYEMAQKIREIVESETQADAAEATKDWQRVTDHYGVGQVSAMPGVSLRPGVNGFEVVARYITRAPQRNAVKSKLFHAIVDLLCKYPRQTPIQS